MKKFFSGEVRYLLPDVLIFGRLSTVTSFGPLYYHRV